ncbi:hypothetical protein HGRIS_008120 [Hohenbuehelia grisea]|uniref:Homeobox domain-containing protein n=1 Tax=Hohenbuehelia grisea TaxID=104357 RepID=A0ABR3J7H0_9AGAR
MSLTAPTAQAHKAQNALLLLATVAAEQTRMHDDSDDTGDEATSSSSASSSGAVDYPSPPPDFDNHLHITCAKGASPTSPSKPLKQSHMSNSIPTPPSSSPGLDRSKQHRMKTRGARSKTVVSISYDRKRKQQEVKERALKIKTVENSPVNQRQLLVLRMVFDQITMYPSETWMAIIAVTIRRALKQVKNWFSNERQKQHDKREEDVVRMISAEGEKLRLRPIAVSSCGADEWSDAFFEEVVMIYNIKTSNKLRSDEARRTAVESVSVI